MSTLGEYGTHFWQILHLGSLLIEAERNDSVMNIARQAADAGVQVGAVPGSIHNPAYKGCHQLIRDGAALVEMITDIGLRKAPAGKLMT